MMFLITPTPKKKPQIHDEPPLRIPTRSNVPPRVKQACIRCHIKKIKCEGRIPCQRCTRDHVNCQLDRRDRTELKELSRSYITSLETQQGYLLDALRQLCRNRGDTQDPGVQDILKRLEASGVEIDAIQHLDSRRALDANNPENGHLMQSAGHVYGHSTRDLLSGHPIQPPLVDDSQNQSRGANSFPPFATSASLGVPTADAATHGDWSCPQGITPIMDSDASLDWTMNANNQAWPSASGMDELFSFNTPDFANQWWESWTNITESINAAENSVNVIMESNGHGHGQLAAQQAPV